MLLHFSYMNQKCLLIDIKFFSGLLSKLPIAKVFRILNRCLKDAKTLVDVTPKKIISDGAQSFARAIRACGTKVKGSNKWLTLIQSSATPKMRCETYSLIKMPKW